MTRPGRRRALTELAAASAGAAAAIVAGLSFTSAFTAGRLVPLLLVAGGVGLVVGLLASSGRAPWVLRLLAVLGGAAAVLAVATASPVPTDWLTSVVDGPRRLLTGGLPADDDAAARGVPLLAVYVASALGAGLARRGRGPWAVVPSALVLGAGTAVGLAEGDAAFGVALAWIVLAVVVAGWRRPNADPTTADPAGALHRRRPLGAVVLLVAALAAGALVASRTDDAQAAERATLRDVVEEPPVDTAARNPLDEVTLLLASPERTLGRATIEDPFLDSLPVATFTAYDGDTFPFAPEVEPAGRELPSGAPEGPVRAATNRLVLDGWPTVALPHTGRARSVEAPAELDLAYDPVTGRLLALEPGPGELVITTEVPDVRRRPAAPYGSWPEARAATELPVPVDELPDTFDALVSDLVARRLQQPGARAFAESVAAEFQAQLRAVEVGDPERDGVGLVQLGCVVDGGLSRPREGDCEGVGTRIQLAAAYVVGMRAVGVPARLVVGFDRLQPGLPQVLSSHRLTAWAEVAIEGEGWVAVDPVDEDDTSSSVPPPEPTGEGTGDGDDDEQSDSDDADAATVAAGDDGRDPPVAAVAAIGLVVVAVAAPGLVRVLRARRRRRGDPASRVRGAWWEARDRLVERGVRLAEGATVTRVLSSSGSAGRELAPLVNAVAFGGAVPTDAEADAAWAAVRDDERAWRRAAPWSERIRRWWRVARRRPRSRRG